MLQKIITFCKSYIELCFWLLFFAIGTRCFEAILLSGLNHNLGASILWNLTGLCYDIALFLRISIVGIVLFVAASFLSEKITRVVFRILLSIMLILSLICIVFFITSGFLLDKVVLAYSFKEMWAIVMSSSKSPVWVYITITVLPVLYFFISKKRVKIHNIGLGLYAVLTILSFFFFFNLSLDTAQYHVKTNKEHFFLKSIFPSFKKNVENITATVDEFRSYFPEHQFVETEFPFLYQAHEKDVLSPFFNLKSEPPNLVFIIVEGLDYDLCYNDYQLMPFLSSLSEKSLAWEHCLSVASRTYGVLPALFGAAPLGEKGFMEQCPNNPECHTLLNILHQNKYNNRFFYGGWIDFDNMAFFFQINNTTYLEGKDWDQDITNEKIGTHWGYEDHLTYSQAHRILNQSSTSPRIEIYMSLSTHDPFVYPKSSYFQNIVKNKITQNKTLSKQKKKNILDSLNIYGSFAYSDWALQQLMEGYQKRDDFENTIFIITGDHSVFAKQFGGYSNFHVPLMIYSPMLKAPRKMKGVVSHRDITPTLLSMLQHHFKIETPKEVAWLNTALDTSLTFQANTFSPLQLIDRNIGGILYKNYMFCEGVLEELTDSAPRKIENFEIYQKMDRLLTLYQSLDLYAHHNNALIRNPYAYRSTPKSAIIDIVDTIAPDSYFAKSSQLPVVEGPQEHKTTLYFDADNTAPMDLLRFDIDNDIDLFRVDIEFKIYLKTNEKSQYLAVISDISQSYFKAEFIAADNNWFTFKNSVTYRKELWKDVKTKPFLNVYIANSENLEGYMDDIKVTVSLIK
jgi:phosphoglycerol transferase MdoB-like AlkP superfamily enzyme